MGWLKDLLQCFLTFLFLIFKWPPIPLHLDLQMDTTY